MFATPSHLPKLLPWVDWQEWQLCSDQLFAQWSIAQPPYSTTDAASTSLPIVRFSSPPSFSPSLCLRHRSALERISLWRLRGRLPLSIESTAELVEALHIDAAFASSFTSPSSSSSPASLSPAFVSSDRSVRDHYALALLRFVNSVVDVQQSRGMAVSVAHLASAVQLPRLLVDVRHEATHGVLPALSVLRYAAMEAVRWLYRRYWKAQEERSSGAQRRLSRRLRAYQQRAEADLSSSSTLSPAAHTLLSEAFEQSLTSSQLSALLLPTLFGAPTPTSRSPARCLQPPTPLYLHPCAPVVVAHHFQHLQAVWQPLLSVAVRRIRRFRVDAIQLMVGGSAALHQQRATTKAGDALAQERTEEAEDDEQEASVQWQVQLTRLWCQHLLASLNEEEKRPSSLFPLADLCIAASTPLVEELHSQLLPLLAPHLSSTALPQQLCQWLASSQTLAATSFTSFSSSSFSPTSIFPASPSPSPTAPPLPHPPHSTPSWSLAELRSAVQRAKEMLDGEELGDDEEMGRSIDRAKRRRRVTGEEQSQVQVEFGAAAAVSRCTEWTACPLGALPFQAQSTRLPLPQRQLDCEVNDEGEAVHSVDVDPLQTLSPASPPLPLRSSAVACPPHLVGHLRTLQAAVLAL